MQTEPIVELTINVSFQDDTLKLGDTSYLNAEPLGIQTMITLNGVSGNPLTNDSPMTLTLDNSTVSRTNINYDMSDKIRLSNRNNRLLTKEVQKLSAKIRKLESQEGS
ncbi:prophage Lp2 protein 50 [Companilactobacillus farciminis]|nr:prophage Lp2 protein 50 [Companilactobacillus farciminis]